MKHAHGARRKNSHAIEKKSTGVKSQKKSMHAHPWVCGVLECPFKCLDCVLGLGVLFLIHRGAWDAGQLKGSANNPPSIFFKSTLTPDPPSRVAVNGQG